MDFAKTAEQVAADGVKLDATTTDAATTAAEAVAPSTTEEATTVERTSKEEFEYWVQQVKVSPPNPNLTNDDKLKVYALYKQATVGDVQGSQPWAVQLEARAKWDAWNAIKGKTSEEAMKEYAQVVKAQMATLPK